MKVITAPAFYNTGSAYATRVAQTVTFDGPINIQGGYANGGGAPYDGVVDAGGGGNWTTIQAGDDALDGGNFTMLVKSGTYAESPTISTNNATIVFEPGTDIQGLITLSGNNISLIFGGGCDIDGLLVSGDDCYINGGGWDTIVDGGNTIDAAVISGDDCILENITLNNATSGSHTKKGLFLTGLRASTIRVKVLDASQHAMASSAGGDDWLCQGCVILGADDGGIVVDAPRARIIGNRVINVGADGISLGSGGDDSLATGNVVENAGGDTIIISGTGDDCCVVANRLDGAVSNTAGTSTVASNEETAF